MVLLENDGALPLKNTGKIALYGAGARHTIKGGTGSGDVNSREVINIEQGLKDAGFTITTDRWLTGDQSEEDWDNLPYQKWCREELGIIWKPAFVAADSQSHLV